MLMAANNLEKSTLSCVDALIQEAKRAGVDILVRAFAGSKADGLIVEVGGVTVAERGITADTDSKKVAAQVARGFPQPKGPEVKR